MKRILNYSLCLLSLSFGEGLGEAVAQTNLVPNPSFETDSLCPNGGSEIKYASPWYSPTGGSPDYFRPCWCS